MRDIKAHRFGDNKVIVFVVGEWDEIVLGSPPDSP